MLKYWTEFGKNNQDKCLVEIWVNIIQIQNVRKYCTVLIYLSESILMFNNFGRRNCNNNSVIVSWNACFFIKINIPGPDEEMVKYPCQRISWRTTQRSTFMVSYLLHAIVVNGLDKGKLTSCCHMTCGGCMNITCCQEEILYRHGITKKSNPVSFQP